MKIKLALLLTLPLLLTAATQAQDPAHATEFRMQHPGNGPDGKPAITFLAHRLGTDHSEGISLLDMNGDGFTDLLSGAYWYENPGADGGEWKQHQFRTVGIHNEFINDCGEWIIDVDHDGQPDLVTTGWISNGLWWYRNPGPKATAAGEMWKAEKITDSFDTEGGAFADINGDGKPDIALAHYNRAGVLWVDFSGDKPRAHHVGGTEQDGHGIGIADINGDGKADILTTHGWFEQIDANNDKWQWHPEWTLGDAGFPILGYDVNHDGKLDLIYGQGHGYGLYWLEQTGTPAHRTWKRHTIDESFSQSHALAHYNRAGVLWVDFSGDKPRAHHVGGTEQDGHGIGIADINGDGKADILTTHGWFEQIDANNDKWQWHPEWTLGDAGFPILGYDVNHDGKLDLIYGQGHGYGLYWLEQTGTAAHHTWKRHTIDESFSQSHALALVDIDGDGTPELITGKRYRGHSGDDPGSYDPVVVYAYKLPTKAEFASSKSDPAFTRIALSVNGTASAGTQFVAADLDHDGDIDIASAGKLGVHVLENLKIDKHAKSAREATQPLNRKWPFPGEGEEVPQEDGPKPK